MYFMTLIDDYSRMIWIFIMKHKIDAFKNFKQWKTLMENQIGRRSRCYEMIMVLNYVGLSLMNFARLKGLSNIIQLGIHLSRMV